MSRKRKRTSTRSESKPLRDWAIRDPRGRTCLVIQATSAAAATERVGVLLHESPPIPRRFTVVEHEGPVQCSWFGEGWFRVREDVDRAGLDAESRFWRQLRDPSVGIPEAG